LRGVKTLPYKRLRHLECWDQCPHWPGRMWASAPDMDNNSVRLIDILLKRNLIYDIMASTFKEVIIGSVPYKKGAIQMIKTKENIPVTTENNRADQIKMYLHDLSAFDGASEALGMYAHAKLLPGEEVGFHIHEGESEIYYVLSGKAIYDDNGEKVEIGAGDVTFTPSGTGHGIANIGKETLEFMALVVKN